MATTSRVVTHADKSFPEVLYGAPIDSFTVPLAQFSTPLLAIDEVALTHNIRTMAAWAAARGVELMPHGKTTMAPAIWRRQLASGATGLSVATGWQAEQALAAGIPTVQIANACTDPHLLRRLGRHAAPGGDGPEVVCWADDAATIDLMTDALPARSRIGVLVELGAAGGRTGARDPGQLLALAERVAASPVLELRGVAGYEGALAHDRSPDCVAAVRDYAGQLRDAFEQVRPLAARTPWLTVGGSAFFDIVADAIAPLPEARVILRPGAYVVHDDGFYRSISPLDPQRVTSPDTPLRSAMRGYARVVSTPEPGLALLDGGRRDFPFDEGLPVPIAIAAALGGPERPLHAQVTALNDQHAFLRWSGNQAVSVGDVVRLGLSHPCTAFDKWRLIPLIDVADASVRSAIETFF